MIRVLSISVPANFWCINRVLCNVEGGCGCFCNDRNTGKQPIDVSLRLYGTTHIFNSSFMLLDGDSFNELEILRTTDGHTRKERVLVSTTVSSPKSDGKPAGDEVRDSNSRPSTVADLKKGELHLGGRL